jgi:hypothetical protein
MASAALPSRFMRFLQLFAHPRALPAIVVLAALIALPTLRMGFFGDDYIFIAEIEHNVPSSGHTAPLDLYRFASGDRTEHDRSIRDGPYPWFSDPSYKMHFSRPLTSLMLTLDHSIWGHSALGYQLTSVLLYAALVFCVGLFYRVAVGVHCPGPASVTATLAALLFAIDPHHIWPAGLIACRHLVVAAIAAALGLAAHVRFVRDRWRPGAWLGPLGIIVALLGSEAGLGAVACWLAFDAFGPAAPHRSSLRRRLLASMPVLALTAVYASIYFLLGFGAAGDGIYFDPIADPLGFLLATAERVPILTGLSLTGFPDYSPMIFPGAPFVVVGFAVVAALFALYRLIRPAITDEERATLRWLLPGAVLSLVPASAGVPSARLLLFPSIGSAFFVAVLIYRGSQRIATAGPRPALRVGRGLLVAVHVVLAPLLFVAGSTLFAEVARKSSQVFFQADINHSATSHVVVLAVWDPFVAVYPGWVAQALAPRAISAWHVLSMAENDHRFTRTGPASFRLDVIGRAIGRAQVAYRSPHTPLHVGDYVELTGATVTVRAVDGLVPTSLDVMVDVPLDSPTLALLTWRDGRLVRFVPPPVGASVDLRRSHPILF